MMKTMTTTARRSRAHRYAATALVATVVITAGCGGSAKTTSPTSTTAPTTSTVPAGRTTVDVYFVLAQKLVAAGRTVPVPATPAAALRALLAGPSDTVDRDLGFTTSIPTGTSLNGVTVAGAVATVDLSGSFATGGGSQSMQARVAQIVFTATQFPGIDRVRFRLDGTAVTSIGGEGVLVDGVGRDTFTNVTPLILVESPTPGATVGSTVHVRGIANTFERTVNYTLTDAAGKVVKEGFTTGTGVATGKWGPFALDVTLPATLTGTAQLSVYQLSGETGSRTDVVAVPLQLAR